MIKVVKKKKASHFCKAFPLVAGNFSFSNAITGKSPHLNKNLNLSNNLSPKNSEKDLIEIERFAEYMYNSDGFGKINLLSYR